jgi:glucokinase
MAEFALVGDIGGTNSRFGLVNPGSMAILHMEALRNDNFPSLEGAIQQYLRNRHVKFPLICGDCRRGSG